MGIPSAVLNGVWMIPMGRKVYVRSLFAVMFTPGSPVIIGMFAIPKISTKQGVVKGKAYLSGPPRTGSFTAGVSAGENAAGSALEARCEHFACIHTVISVFCEAYV
jgi:hypothetical protein